MQGRLYIKDEENHLIIPKLQANPFLLPCNFTHLQKKSILQAKSQTYIQ